MAIINKNPIRNGLVKSDYSKLKSENKKLKERIEELEKQLLLHNVINWVVCKDVKPIDGKEYLISDGEDVTEAQWYDDSKWGGEPYDSYTHYADKPKPPCL
jgi:hypothetical protein